MRKISRYSRVSFQNLIFSLSRVGLGGVYVGGKISYVLFKLQYRELYRVENNFSRAKFNVLKENENQ